MPEVGKGRARLEKKIVVQETRVQELENAVLGPGQAGSKRGDKRGEWEVQVEGPKVRFAGSMVDCGLLRAAGLMEGVGEGMGLEVGVSGKVGDEGGVEEEKAFV